MKKSTCNRYSVNEAYQKDVRCESIHTTEGIFIIDDDPEIRNALQIYYEAKRAQPVSENTMKIIHNVMERFCDFFTGAGGSRLHQINVRTVQAFINTLDDLAPATRHMYYRNLRTFTFYFEDLTEGVYVSPFHNKALQAPKIPQAKKASVDPETLVKFIRAITGRYALRNKAFFLTAFDSGMRISEICDLRCQDIDLITGKIEVLHGKGNKFRITFVSRTTLKAIRKYLSTRKSPRPTEPLFMNEDGLSLSAQGMQAIRYKIERQCGVKLGGFHAMRRGFAREFLKNGGDLFTLQTLLGHSELETTRGYVQLSDEDLEDIYSRNSPLDRIRIR